MGTQLIPWIGTALQTITALAATAVAYYVASISKRQWKTNQEKLRLDLYERRFEIYLRVLEFYWALLSWEDKPEQIALRGPFIKAFCESKFLFPDESGIYAFLNEFHLYSFRIIGFKSLADSLGEASPQEKLKLANQRVQDVNWILGSMDTLLAKLAPYLNFHSL